MRVISLNINGIRAGARKGFFTWLAAQQPDVVCLQEIKAMEEQLTDAVFFPEGYHRYLFSAEKKGYSGVAIYCKQKPNKVHDGLGFELADSEGRYIQADFDGLSVASLYLPSGTSGEERQTQKYHFMDKFAETLKSFKRKRREFIICGDYNIVHKEIDIKNWKGNKKSSGCLPEERAWLDELFYSQGWVDAFRELNVEAEQYTWWSNRGNARANNVGWRIDYQVVSPGLKDQLVSTSVYKDSWFSDHAPLIVDYK
jgi:exodeoxyribonuclease-3